MTLEKSITRSVARPVANLGNTCYMNAVLQALAHAPELCLAMDVEPHAVSCPIATSGKVVTTTPEKQQTSSNKMATRSSSKSSRARSAGRSKSPNPTAAAADENDLLPFCALCQVEHHIRQVHEKKSDPVSPNAFVHGFQEHVAPWFKPGMQEDSHEFLRLLIDAMQKSCDRARKDGKDVKEEKKKEGDKKEYPFYLFRGTVESTVSCDACGASSSTLDPIEDIGLEVTHNNSNNSNNNSNELLKVEAALDRYARSEALDAGYKCEQCHKPGQARKQSRLASIPPILTLHLKRFRYGEYGNSGNGGGSVASSAYRGSGMNNVSTSTRGGGGRGGDFGKSGSAKIEGHVRFRELFDLYPYLTKDLQQQVKASSGKKTLLCRLFGVVVHSGKNAHSGHYVAFVRNMDKNNGNKAASWYKMDDGRVTVALWEKEVRWAEAYMLFYRIVQHPVSQELEAKMAKRKQQKEEEEGAAKAAAAAAAASSQEKNDDKDKAPPPAASPNTVAAASAPPITQEEEKQPEAVSNNNKRKLFQNGQDWARAKTSLPPHLLGVIRKVQELIADNVQLTPECFQSIVKQANGSGDQEQPLICSTISEADVSGGVDLYRRKLKEIFYQLSQRQQEEEDKKKSVAWLTAAAKDSNGSSSKHGEKEDATSERQATPPEALSAPAPAPPAAAAPAAAPVLRLDDAEELVDVL